MKKASILIAVLLCLPLGIGSVTLQSGYDLFQKALLLERADGKLPEAITLYQRIVAESQDESLAAKAQLQIGMCYEKLGLAEAQKAYQKVIDRYPLQSQVVALAKERIAQLIRTVDENARKPVFQRIRVPIPLDDGAQFSPDGGSLTFSSTRYEGRIWAMPVSGKVSANITGGPVKLTGDLEAWGWGHAWSADGRWIAFNELKNEKDIFVESACVAPSEGGAPRRIPLGVNRGGGFHLFQYCLSLSPDGRELAFSTREGSQSHIYTTPVDGAGAPRLVERGAWQPAYSPNGQRIAFVKERAGQGDNPGSDIWVMPTSGGPPIQLSHLPGRARSPIWSPYGNMIAFYRDPDPTGLSGQELWIFSASDSGTPVPAPTRIDLPLRASLRLVGWTPDNRIGLLLVNPNHEAIYTVPSAGGLSTQVTPEGTFHPSWSPDGTRIFFQSAQNLIASVASVPSEGGQISRIPIGAGLNYTGALFPRISPNGQEIVFPSAREGSAEIHLWAMPVAGGQPRQLTHSPGTDVFPDWSPDGKSILFSRQVKAGNSYQTTVHVIPAAGGQARVLAHIGPGRATKWSVDGESITYVSGNQIRTAPVDGGESRILTEVEKGKRVYGLAWAPDGTRLAYTTDDGIFVVSLEPAKTIKIATGVDGTPVALAWSPDGKRIAFGAHQGGDLGLWMLEVKGVRP